MEKKLSDELLRGIDIVVENAAKGYKDALRESLKKKIIEMSDIGNEEPSMRHLFLLINTAMETLNETPSDIS